MQTKYVWIIILLANVWIVKSSNVERSKRDISFIKNLIANFFGYNTNNAIMTNEDNIKFLYPVSNYQVLMNAMPDPYFNQNIYQGSLAKILIPSNMVMQPVINFGRQNVPYITAFDERSYKRPNANFDSSQVYGNMQSVPNYNRVEVPLVRCNDEIPVSYKKNVTNDSVNEVSSAVSKPESHELPELQSVRDSEEISKEVDIHTVASSQSSESEDSIEIPVTTPEMPVRESQPIKTSTTSPTSTVNVVPTELSSFYASTISTTELPQINTSKPSTFTNAHELTTSNVITTTVIFTTPPPSPSLAVTNVQKNETLDPIIPPIEKKDEEIKSTSTTIAPVTPAAYKQDNKDDMNKNFNRTKKIVTFTEPVRTRFAYKKVNKNKPNEDRIFKMENIKYPKVSESQDDLMVQPSKFNPVINVLNSIAPIRGKVLNPPNIYIPQDTDDTLEEIDSEDIEINNQPTDVYASDSEELDYLNQSPIILDESSYGSIQEDVSGKKANESLKDFRWIMPQDSSREISRRDVPDM